MKLNCQVRTGTRSRSAEQTRQQILDAALRLFAARGYAGTGTKAIVETGHVTKPVLYYYFGNKAGLFRAIVDQNENRLLELISKIKGEAKKTPERLLEICAAMFQFACDRPEVMSLAVDLLLQAKEQRPPHKHCFGKAQKRLAVIQEVMEQGKLEGTLRKQLDSRQLAVGFLGMIHLHILYRLANPGSPLTRHAAETAVSLFLKGAAAEDQKAN
jgi:AcrR family transcriptional regulator